MAEYECHAETERGWQLVAESRTLNVAIEKARRVLRANRELGEIFVTIPPPPSLDVPRVDKVVPLKVTSIEERDAWYLRSRQKIIVVERRWRVFILTRSLTNET